jgi:two-component system LytT family response regulator
MTHKVVIVDDEPLARERIRDLLAGFPRYDLAAETGDGAEALGSIVQLRPALVFLDVQMPELDGFDVLEALAADPLADPLPAIVFVTAYDEYAVRAFEVNAVDYLLKPVESARFAAAMVKVDARMAGDAASGTAAASEATLRTLLAQLRGDRRYATRFVVRSEGRIVFVRPAEVDWIEAAGNYAQLHAGRRTLPLRETMKSLEARLDPDVFVRVHRSAIVNLDRIAAMEPYFHGEYVLKLRDGGTLTSSRAYSARLRELVR